MILIQAIGSVPPQLLGWLREELTQLLGVQVEILEPVGIPKGSFDPEKNKYNAQAIVDYLDKLGHREILLGIIDLDIGLFGFSNKNALVSIEPLLDADPRVFYERVLKQSMHELGHTFKLSDCYYTKCAMYPTHKIDVLDTKTHHFCDRCLHLLKEK